MRRPNSGRHGGVGGVSAGLWRHRRYGDGVLGLYLLGVRGMDRLIVAGPRAG